MRYDGNCYAKCKLLSCVVDILPLESHRTEPVVRTSSSCGSIWGNVWLQIKG